MKIEDYKEAYKLWSNTAEMGMRSLDDSEEGIAKFLRRNPTSSFVATLEKQIGGVILAGHDGRRGYIYHTAVDIAYRGNDLGAALVKAVVDAFEKEGINRATLVVFKPMILVICSGSLLVGKNALI